MNTALVGAVRWRGVGVFLLLAFGLSWAAMIGLRAAGVPLVARAAAAMYGPALAAWLVRGPLLREGFADAGLRPRLAGGGWRWYLVTYLAAPLLLAATVVVALATTAQRWGPTENVAALVPAVRDALTAQGQSPPFGMDAEEFTRFSVWAGVVQAFTLALPINMLFAFGEEFGWRGYLLPRLLPLGPARASLLVGGIWGVWHAPLIVLDGYNFPGHPWLGVAAMVAFTAAWSAVFTWLRVRSGSVWPAVLLHAALNAQAGIVLLIVLTPADSLVRAPLGLLGTLPDVSAPAPPVPPV